MQFLYKSVTELKQAVTSCHFLCVQVLETNGAQKMFLSE